LIPFASILAVLCGGAVGFSLGLIGGGGSILAVPMLLYIVGVKEPHIAIGTSAFAVSISAFINFFEHWRAGNVVWPCALLFASAGVIGAALGSTIGKTIDGQKLLLLFALVMVAVGCAMLIPRKAGGTAQCRLEWPMAIRLSGLGAAAGFVSGFFGIGGGFLIVPGIMYGSGITILPAIGSSLFSVGAFGLTTAVNYAVSGLVDWPVAFEFIAGGILGGVLGLRSAVALAGHKRGLTYLFVAVVFVVAGYIVLRSAA
jgi:uncharacterized membrane protein YfcA